MRKTNGEEGAGERGVSDRAWEPWREPRNAGSRRRSRLVAGTQLIDDEENGNEEDKATPTEGM